MSIREALWFDVRAPESSDEDSLADWRVAALEHAPLLLGITHLLITVACVFLLDPARDPVFRPTIR